MGEKNKRERTIKDYARKFYEIMEKSTGFVDGIWISEQLDKKGWSINGNPHVLWRIWRQTENDYPVSIEFIPQSSTFWRSKPSGWRYIGPPQYFKKKKKLK